MSDTVGRIIARASSDAAFREQLRRNPVQALAAYPLSAAEREALLRVDTRPLHPLHVEPRTTKHHHHTLEERDPFAGPPWVEG
jgi:hypothetical protein